MLLTFSATAPSAQGMSGEVDLGRIGHVVDVVEQVFERLTAEFVCGSRWMQP